VSRQEIIERLWGKDVFLDTEHGINTSVRKIRRALKEDVERPRFIQTVSGKGYRFVPDEATTNSEGTGASAKVVVPADEALTPASIEAGPITTRDGWVSRKWALAAVVLLFLAGATLAFNVARLHDLVFAKNSIGRIHSVAVSVGEYIGRSLARLLRRWHDRRPYHGTRPEPVFARDFTYFRDPIQRCGPAVAGNRTGAWRRWDPGRIGPPFCQPCACKPPADLRAHRYPRLGGKLRSRSQRGNVAA
jgi:Transcriptional regulatory protein, C terminal